LCRIGGRERGEGRQDVPLMAKVKYKDWPREKLSFLYLLLELGFSSGK
jgi:hypothetical protein